MTQQTEQVRGNQALDPATLRLSYYMSGPGSNQILIGSGDVAAQARRIIAKLLQGAITSVNNTPITLDEIKAATGGTIPSYINSPVTIEGVSLARFYNNPQQQNYNCDVKAGDTVIFDVVTGAGCTGLNPTWGWSSDQYKVLGVCISDYKDSITGKGIYAPQQDDGSWLIPIQIQQSAAPVSTVNAERDYMFACLRADLNYDDPWVMVAFSDNTFPLGNPASSVKAGNIFCESGKVGDMVLVVKYYLQDEFQWVITEVKKTAVPLVNSVTYDYNAGKLIQHLTTVSVAKNPRPAVTQSDIVQFAPPGSDNQRLNTSLTLSSNLNTIVYGQTFTLTATLTWEGSADASGVVAFVVNGIPLGIAEVGSNGIAAFSALATELLPFTNPGGDLVIVATYIGDSSYNPSTADFITIHLNASDVAVTIALNPLSPVSPRYGDSIGLDVTVTTVLPALLNISPSYGWISFYDGDQLIGNAYGQAYDNNGFAISNTWSLWTTAIQAGNRKITAIFNPKINAVNNGQASIGISVRLAPLTFTVENATTTYGTPAVVAYSASGFFNDDTLGNFTGELKINSQPVTANVGNYTLSLSTGTLYSNNYYFVFLPATLTITPASLSCIVNDATMRHGNSLPAFTANIAGVMNGDTIVVSYNPNTDGKTIGFFTIDATLGGAKINNYYQSVSSGTLEVV